MKTSIPSDQSALDAAKVPAEVEEKIGDLKDDARDADRRDSEDRR